MHARSTFALNESWRRREFALQAFTHLKVRALHRRRCDSTLRIARLRVRAPCPCQHAC
jgi:hypothetical protein